MEKNQEETIDEVKEALVAFFTRQDGGYQEVAKTIGVNVQQLYYIISGRNAPTLKTVMRILQYFPDEVGLRQALSLPMLKSVATSLTTTNQGLDLTPIIAAKDEMIQAQARLIDKLALRVDVLELRNEVQAAQIVKLSDRDFPESDSQTTVLQHHQTMHRYQDAGTALIKTIGFETPNRDVKAKPVATLNIMEQLNLIDEGDHYSVPARKYEMVLL